MPKNSFFTLSSGVCWLLWLSARCLARERTEIQRQSSGLSRNWYSVKVLPRGLICEHRTDVSEERPRRERALLLLSPRRLSSFYLRKPRTKPEQLFHAAWRFHGAFFFNDQLGSIVLTFSNSWELTKSCTIFPTYPSWLLGVENMIENLYEERAATSSSYKFH